ncbi:hypothetical protein OF83DRAFT_1175514 [Amylostereum chailletii]|nr:hypothetical protein OF83DRAFT_1175514 [Amylostereum chailletii]
MTRYQLTRFSPAQPAAISSLSVSYDGQFTASGGSSGIFAIYRNPSLQPVHIHDPISSPAAAITAIAWSDMSRGVLFLGDTLSRIHVVHLDLVQNAATVKIFQVEHLNISTIFSLDVHGGTIAIATPSTRHALMPPGRSPVYASLLPPFTLQFKDKSVLLIAYVGYGLVAWDTEEGTTIWTLPFGPDDILHASLHPNGSSLIATLSSSRVAWFTIPDHSFMPQAVRVHTTSPKRKDTFAMYINDGNAAVLAGQASDTLRIVSTIPQEGVRVIQKLKHRNARNEVKDISAVAVGCNRYRRYIVTALSPNGNMPATIILWYEKTLLVEYTERAFLYTARAFLLLMFLSVYAWIILGSSS